MADPSEQASGRPAIGNILGFALLFRDRKALLTLERRVLGPGVRVGEYEAEITGVELPLSGPLSAHRFRHYRCRAHKAQLVVERDTLEAWLTQRWREQAIAGIRLSDLRIELGSEPSPEIRLRVDGRTSTGGLAWISLSVRLEPWGRWLYAHRSSIEIVGHVHITADDLWHGLTQALKPIGHAQGPSFVVDPTHLAIARPFVASGWKAPDPSAMSVRTLSLSRRAIEIDLDAEGSENPPLDPPAPGSEVRTTRAQGLDRVRALLDQGDRADAIAQLRAMLPDQDDPAAAAAMARWLVELTGARDPQTCLEAARHWVVSDPGNPVARRTLVARLGLAGDWAGLAKVVTASCRLPHPPRQQARLELTLALLLAERLDDPTAGLALLDPLVDRLRDDEQLNDLLPAALEAQGRTHASGSPHRPGPALRALDEALSLTADPDRRADLITNVARHFLEGGAPGQALALLLRACRESPKDDDLLDLAIEGAIAADDREAAVALLETRVERTDPRGAGLLRRRLIDLLLERRGPGDLARALEHLRLAVPAEPHAVDLLHKAADLETRLGSKLTAIDHLRRLVALERQPGMRVPLRIELARLLEGEDRRREAWQALSPALEESSPVLLNELTELALHLAPDDDRDRVVERILAGGGTAGGRVLLERALTDTSVSRRVRDLRAAAELLDDPRPALRALAQTASDDPEAWSALAQACQRHDDETGEKEARLEAALLLLERGDHERAVAELRVHTRRFSDDSDGQLALAVALGRTGGVDEALTLLEQIVPQGTSVELSPRWMERLRLEPEPGAVELLAAKLNVERRVPQAAASWFRRAREQGPEGGSIQLEAAARLVDVLAGLGHREEALDAAMFMVDRCEGRDRSEWLVRAAGFAPASVAARLLREALDIGADHASILDAYERVLRQTNDLDGIEDVFRRRLSKAHDPAARARILQRWIDFIREHDLEDQRRDVLIGLLTDLVKLKPGDVDLMKALAHLCEAENRTNDASKLWQKLFDLLSDEDPRGFLPAMRVAVHAFEQARPGDARTAVQRAVDLQPHDPGALQLMAKIAEALSDAQLTRRAAEGLLHSARSDQERAMRQLELARSDRQLGRITESLDRLRIAAALAERESPLHSEIAETWLETATLPDRRPESSVSDTEDSRRNARLQQESAARAELRRARGATLAPLERRNEARVLIELARFEEAREILEEGLRNQPSHELLLSSLKEVCIADDDLEPYLEALTRAVSLLTPGDVRDRLATELAFSAMQQEDANRVLTALDHIGAHRAQTPELLDLRDWAIRALGREDSELEQLQTKLLTSPRDRGLLHRLRRLMGDDAACVERLLGLSERVQDDAALPLSECALVCAIEARDPNLIVQSLESIARHGASAYLSEQWPACEALIVNTKDSFLVASLARIATDLEQMGATEFGARATRILAGALAQAPRSGPLHQALWERAGRRFSEVSERVDATAALLREVAETHELPTRTMAELVVGLAGQLDRRHGANLLTQHGIGWVDDEAAFSIIMAALEEGNHWPDLLRLLELQAQHTAGTDAEVEVYKRLAHVCGDVLQDSDRALHYLELARKRAPRDADVLLALLERYYARRELDQAIDLTSTVLTHVPMGDKAFAALAHRAVDAAFARNDNELAEALLRRVSARVPEDQRTQDRLQELAAMAGEPEARVKLLASVAQRQGGSARIEALEERARLLVDPLERFDEAIGDLQAVLAEAPERTESRTLLEHILERRERWTELVTLLESEFPRLRGPSRSRVLGRIATIQRDKLQDMARAEQSIRLALENLGSPTADVDLAETLRSDLLDCLQRQGRYLDLGIYLERELTVELDDQAETEDLHPARLDLLVRLARLHRDELGDDQKAVRVFERLERLGHLPDDGLATLARWYRTRQRHADLVRVLRLRAEIVAEDPERRAAVHQRIAELLEGPLGRPHDAARYWLDAYLADPGTNTLAGARARVLLSGTDSVANVRQHMLERLEHIEAPAKPALLTLLADILAPQDDYEREAETTYRQAIALDPTFAAAHEGLGRMLAREGRLSLAVDPLCTAARSLSIEPARAAEDAAIAARALFELGRIDEAERILQHVLNRAPDAQRALLELARLYHRSSRPEAESKVLDELSTLPLSSMLKAEVAYRRSMLLEPQFAADPLSVAGERARAYFLEAVSADGGHVAARQALLELARKRGEWSIVAHMHYLAIRELSPGPQRALVHLELAGTYLQNLGDTDSALRNVESAIQQAPNDVMVVQRVSQLVQGMPEPGKAAERFEQIAGGDNELDDAARARLWLLAGDLRMQEDDVSAAEAASQRVLKLEKAPQEVTNAAARRLDSLMSDGTRDLKRQKSGLLRLLESEEQAAERMHILARLREIGQSLGDRELVERVSRKQLDLARDLPGTEDDEKAALAALRDILAQRGEYRHIVSLHEEVAQRTQDPQRAVGILLDAAQFAWHGVHNVNATVAILQRALSLQPGSHQAEAMLAEVVRTADPSALHEYLQDELAAVASAERTTSLTLQLAEMARRVGRHEDAVAVLKQLLEREIDPRLELQALLLLDAALDRVGQPAERLGVLIRAQKLAEAIDPGRAGDLACELAGLQVSLGKLDEAAELCRRVLGAHPGHQGLLRVHVDLLERREDWPALAETLAELAEGSLDREEREHWLTRAAKVHLEHPEVDPDPRRAASMAWNLLERARAESSTALETRTLLLTLSYQRSRWEESFELAQEIQVLGGESVPELVLGALAEALVRNRKGLAAAIGQRLDETQRQEILWPAIRHVLDEIATKGPLPRLDAILAAAADLIGGGYPLLREMKAYAGGQSLHAGLSIALGRLYEASGDAPMARALYQLAAFMAPNGPIPPFVARLPDPQLPEDPLEAPGWSSLAERGTLRTVLIELRPYLVGIRTPVGRTAEPSTPVERDLMSHAQRIVAPWRLALSISLPIVFSLDAGSGPIQVRNTSEPCIVLGRTALGLSEGELRFRLAWATGSIAMGLAILRDAQPASLGDVLDALGQLVNPAHEPRSPASQIIADTLASRGVRADRLTPEIRRSLAEELVHWTVEPGALAQLEVVLARAEILFATRLSGRLDGALMALAREHGFNLHGHEMDPAEVLATEMAHWLLRTIGLH